MGGEYRAWPSAKRGERPAGGASHLDFLGLWSQTPTAGATLAARGPSGLLSKKLDGRDRRTSGYVQKAKSKSVGLLRASGSSGSPRCPLRRNWPSRTAARGNHSHAGRLCQRQPSDRRTAPSVQRHAAWHLRGYPNTSASGSIQGAYSHGGASSSSVAPSSQRRSDRRRPVPRRSAGVSGGRAAPDGASVEGSCQHRTCLGGASVAVNGGRVSRGTVTGVGNGVWRRAAWRDIRTSGISRTFPRAIAHAKGRPTRAAAVERRRGIGGDRRTVQAPLAAEREAVRPCWTQ